jgi:hypothetical protein
MPAARSTNQTLIHYAYGLITLIIFICLGVGFLRKHDGDWDVTYLLSARHLWQGQSIYHNGDGYIYPPFPALFALPFAYLPGVLPKLTWYLVTVASLILMCRWSWRLAGGAEGYGRVGVAESGSTPSSTASPPHSDTPTLSSVILEHAAFLLALIPGATYAFNCISHSQTDIVIGFAIIAGCVALTRGKSLLAATLYGLAASMKGPALIWFAYLIARRKPVAGLWMLGVILAANLAPSLIDHHRPLLLDEWVHDYLLPKKTNVYPDVWSTESNQSLMGSITRWTTTRWEWVGKTYQQRIPLFKPLPPARLKAVILGCYACLLVMLANALGWWPKPLQLQFEISDLKSQVPRSALEFSMIATLMLVCSPMAAKAQWGILMLPAFCLARLWIIRRDKVILFCFITGWLAWLASQNFLGRNGVFVGLWYGAVLWNALIWFVGCAYALASESPNSDTRNPNEISSPNSENIRPA